MSTYKVELADTYTVSMRNGASVVVETAKVAALLPELLAYGIGQKVRDAASGATKAAEAEGSEGVRAEAQRMMESAVAALVAGEWSHRGEGATVDPRVSIGRSIMRKLMKDTLGKDSPEWATFTGLSDADQLAKIDENVAANAELIEPAIAEELARREAKKAAAKAVAKKVKISI